MDGVHFFLAKLEPRISCPASCLVRQVGDRARLSFDFSDARVSIRTRVHGLSEALSTCLGCCRRLGQSSHARLLGVREKGGGGGVLKIFSSTFVGPGQDLNATIME